MLTRSDPTFLGLFLTLQITLASYGQNAGSLPSCYMGMKNYSQNCAQWTILSAIAFRYSDGSCVNVAKSYLSNVTCDCDNKSRMKIFLPGSTTEKNDQDTLYAFPDGTSTLLNWVDPYAAQLPGNATSAFEGLLTYMVNLAITTSTQAGAAFIFTDLDCSTVAPFVQNFISSMTKASYNIRIFFYGGYCSLDCDSSTCQMQFGTPNSNGETTCLKDTDIATTIHPPLTTTSGGGAWGDFPTALELGLLIGIPCFCFIVLCAICACCCCKCMEVKKAQAQIFAQDKIRKKEFNGFWKRMKQAGRHGAEIPSAPEFDLCEGGMPVPPPNFAVSNHYMDIAHLAQRNKNDYWEFHSKNLLIHDNEVLGAGAFATVYRATVIGKIPLLKAVTGASAQLENTQDGRCEAAVKRLPAHADEQNRKDFFHEMDFMKRLGYHAHVIAMLGCISDQWDPLIVVEYCHYGDLLRFIRGHRSDFFGGSNSNDSNDSQKSMTLSVKSLVSFAWQISDGMSYLASRNFVHRDLAARNVLVTKNMVLKISDFGLCRYTDQALYTAKGGKLPIKWMSIEALKFGEFSPKSDIWSFGVTLWEIFSLGETPYNAVQPTDMLIHLEDGNRLPRPQFSPNEIQDIMNETWNVDSVARPTFDEIRAKMSLMLNLNDECYGYLTVVHKEADKSMCAIIEDEETHYKL